jgi:flavin prenyltransferase
MTENKRIIIGISGASGAIYGLKLLEVCNTLGLETHLIVSKSAEMTIACETDIKIRDLKNRAAVSYNQADMGAAISSGSFKTMGMVIAPCSMRSLGEIANGTTTSLLTRAADVILKDRRKLVLMVRETPLHRGHLKNMLAVTDMGGIIAPPVPAFYNKPENLNDLVMHSVGRVLDLFDLDAPDLKRWKNSTATF